MHFHTINYLKEHGLEKLQSEFGIKANRHEDGRIILNYSQIDSPKTEPVARGARGLVVDSDYNLVANSFHRFFNWGEHKDEMDLFDWSDFTATVKEDGSLILLYYYKGKWHINTRNSFGDGEVNNSGHTWRDLFYRAWDYEWDMLDKESTYVFELCSPYNKVVRQYSKPQLYFITKFVEGIEGDHRFTRYNNMLYNEFNMVDILEFTDYHQILKFLEQKESEDPTFEGVVIRDRNNIRFKVKSASYVALHHMSGNGNIFHPKYIIPFVLSGETSEVLQYFPEVEPKLREVENIVNQAHVDMMEAWELYKDVESQKEFALGILTKTKLSGILFQARKTGRHPDEIFRESKNLLLNTLF